MSGRIVFSDKLEDDGVFPTTLGSLARRSVVLSGAEAVTVNIVESELDPSSVAVTVCCPIVEVGTVKLAENTPRELVVAVVTVPLPLNVMVTSESGSKLMPIIFTGVPTGPEVSLSPMIGFSGAKKSL